MPAAPPTASASACNNPRLSPRNDSARAWAYCPGRCAESDTGTGPMSTATNNARQSLAPGARPVRGAGLCRRLAPARLRIADRLFADRVPAGLLPDSAGRPRRGALRAGHQADAGKRSIRRHPLPGRGPLQEAGRHLLAAGAGGESGRGGRHPAGAHHHLALPAAVAVRRDRRRAADLLDRARLRRRAAPRCWRR